MSRQSSHDFWLTVRVERGVEAQAQLFVEETSAIGHMENWQKQMNPDYDSVFVLPVALPIQRRRRKLAPGG